MKSILLNWLQNLNKVKICKSTFPSSNEVDTLTIKSTKLLVRSHSFIWSSHSASYLSAICDWSALSTNQNAVFAGCRARAREDPPRAGRTTGDACIDVTRVCPGRGAPIFASARRHGAGEAARQRVLSRRRKEEWWDLERRDSHRQVQKRRRRDSHGQGQKRRRRDARAGSEA